MERSIGLRIVATVGFVGMVVVNALANILPINGLNTGEVSALYPSLFTPAGVTFSIWSVIYVLLLGFVVYGWVKRGDSFVSSLLPFFIGSCVLNVSWILVWHFLLPVVSVCVMVMLLIVVVRLFLKVHEVDGLHTGWEQVVVLLPFTLYAAWICVATIANVSALLVWAGWDGGFMSTEHWTALMMGVAALLAILVTLEYKTPAFALVVVWALFGIYLRWRDTEYMMIVYTAVAFQILLAGVIVYVMRRRVLG